MQAAFVHHTAGTIEYAPEHSPGIVLGIARYHLQSNGWNDIGYNFLVDRYGNVFEGRAGGIEAAVIGAQAQGFNDDTTGIACLGTFTALPLDEAAMDALARLIGWKLSIHGIPVNGQVTLISRRRLHEPLPERARRSSSSASAATATPTRPPAPATSSTRQLPTLRTRASRYAFAASGITVKAASQKGAQPVSVSGQLRFADGSSPAGAVLGVEYTTAGSAWTQIGTTNAGPDGAWATSITLPASGQVRAVFGGDGTRPRLESAPVVDQGRAEHDADDGQAARQGGHRVRGQRHALPHAGEGRMPARAPGSQPLGAGAAQAHQRARRRVQRPPCGRRRRVSTASRSSPSGVTRRRTLRAQR